VGSNALWATQPKFTRPTLQHPMPPTALMYRDPQVESVELKSFGGNS